MLVGDNELESDSDFKFNNLGFNGPNVGLMQIRLNFVCECRRLSDK